MEWGKQASQLELMQDAGMEIPALDNRPSIIGFEWLWEAFVELNSCRETGMGIGSIPWTSTQKYTEALRMDEEETWLLHKVVRHLDGLFIEYHNKKSKERSKASTSAGRPSHGQT